MTPQQRIVPLREKFLYILLAAGATETYESTKQCVDIAIKHTIEALDAFGYSGAMYNDFQTGHLTFTDDKLPTDYWHEAKQENENS